MFSGLRHRAVRSRDNQHGSIHLGGAGNHIFNVVGMAGAIDPGVVPFLRFKLNVTDINCQASGSFFGSRVQVINSFCRSLKTSQLRYFENGCRDCGFPMGNVADGTNV